MVVAAASVVHIGNSVMQLDGYHRNDRCPRNKIK